MHLVEGQSQAHPNQSSRYVVQRPIQGVCLPYRQSWRVTIDDVIIRQRMVDNITTTVLMHERLEDLTCPCLSETDQCGLVALHGPRQQWLNCIHTDLLTYQWWCCRRNVTTATMTIQTLCGRVTSELLSLSWKTRSTTY